MRSTLINEMKKLNVSFVEMGMQTNEQIYKAVNAFLNHDERLASTVTKSDISINNDEISLEKLALRVMALQQPVANDFREVVTVLKASADLERIGDHAAGIARETVDYEDDYSFKAINKELEAMTAQVRTMLERVVDAYVRKDVLLAKELAKDDLEVDKYYMKVRQAIIPVVEKDPDMAKSASSYLLVTRLLERIGDHIVNISEWVVYKETGKIVELNLAKSGRNKNALRSDK